MKRVLIRFSVVVWLFRIGFPVAAGADLTVEFLNVGEGEAIHIRTPTNDHILVDTGNVMTGNRVARRLKREGVHALHTLIVTHPHPDHMGGVFVILDQFPVQKIYDNGQKIRREEGDDLYRWYAEYLRRRPNYEALHAHETLKFGEVHIDVLWPIKPVSQDWNINSLVLRVVYQHTAFLLMADAGAQVEEKLAHSGAVMRSSVIKIGHHGSSDASGEAFLRKVSPQYAVISINRENIRGYPSPVVLNRLRSLGIVTYLTYQHGNIRFVSNGNEVRSSIGEE